MSLSMFDSCLVKELQYFLNNFLSSFHFREWPAYLMQKQLQNLTATSLLIEMKVN